MRLPDFVVIGAKKAGSTWLDHALRSHPRIALPAERKEVAFFDLYYERGLEWYAQFFDDLPSGSLVGESTPEYLHHPLAPDRIARDLPQAKLIAILRSPIDRVYSEWSHHVMRFAEQRTFEQFVREQPEVLAKSEYAAQLERFAHARQHGRLHVVILEEALRDPASTLDALGRYLGVDAQGFAVRTQDRANESYRPRFRRGFALARSFSDWMRARELDALSNLAIRLGARRLFGRRGRFAPMTA
ncbi:MAG: sulfotransferase, partial [Phycisphaerae bacterium]|nr:sulfotransferase [Phycisphaerae bacterium]